MKLVAGLGNPGGEYEFTPHNIGFRIVDLIVEKLKILGFQKRFHSHFYTKLINDERCFFIKPQTFMNKSGLAVAECADFYKISKDDIVIISDDIDLPPGKSRFRKGGGHGGHNGLRSVIDSLGNSNFSRMRIGVGRPSTKSDVVSHVLGPWSKADEMLALKVTHLVVDELISFLETSRFENTSFSVLE